MTFDFSKKLGSKRINEFAELLINIQSSIDFKVSARGWGYLMESYGFITKAEFDKVADAINRCRAQGILPVDFVAEESARAFEGVVKPSKDSLEDTLDWTLTDVLEGHSYFIPDYWEDEEYYIQVVVEKIDLKTLFQPVCAEYNIPIANSKGWSSILQRAEYARRFQEAEQQGLKCVLLYGGDFDPDGILISDTIYSNLEQLQHISWSDGTPGYSPENLEIHRFCLDYDFITQNNFTWIDNLITGSGKNLADRRHPNHYKPYVQKYLSDYGARKCEANVMVTTPKTARDLMREIIEEYLGAGASVRFRRKREAVQEKYAKLLEETGLEQPIIEFLENRRAKQ
jgi:hypothetical protein